MKRYFILFILLFSINLSFSQGGPPVGQHPCPCCEDFIDEDTGEPFEGSEGDYAACDAACTPGNSPCLPIDSGILILIALGASLGILKVYQNKKRQFEN